MKLKFKTVLLFYTGLADETFCGWIKELI